MARSTIFLVILCYFIYSNADKRVRKEVEYLQQDFKRYPNMSLVLLQKCSKLAGHKRVPCTLAVLDLDQNLLMKMMERDPFSLVNMVNRHKSIYPDVPLRKDRGANGQCRNPNAIN